MCLLVLFFRVADDAPLIVGANREEFYQRPGEPPRLLLDPVQIVAGVDSAAQGTWLGVNEFGVVVAVTNRLKTRLGSPLRSRGLLVREALQCPTAAEAVTFVTKALERHHYAGCNVVCADRERLAVIQAGDWLRVRLMPTGLHVLTNHDINDASDRRLGHAFWWLEQQAYDNAQDCLEALKQLCAQPGNPDPPMSIHGLEKGTVSSSLIALRTTLSESEYWHAQGPPDRTPYSDYSHVLRELWPSQGKN